MGLVKFNNTTLNIDGVPDGARIIDDAAFNRFTEVSNAYALLKSKMPIGVSEDQLSMLVEKGQRFDSISAELAQTKTSLTEAGKKLETFKNIPEGFSVERWNNFEAAEKKSIFDKKTAQLTLAVQEKLKKDYPDKTPPTVDAMFLPADKVAAFNPDAPNAQDAWAQILGEGFKAQSAFLEKHMSGAVPTPAVGGGNPTPPPTGGNQIPPVTGIPSIASLQQ